MNATSVVFALDEDPIHGLVVEMRLFTSPHGYASARFPIDEPMTAHRYKQDVQSALARARKMDWENDPCRQESLG